VSFTDEEVAYLRSQPLARITPTVSWSWNMAGEAAGDTWYESRRAPHGHGDRDSSNDP
jgi:pyridoxamine 5'-phosphate oxidase family protein